MEQRRAAAVAKERELEAAREADRIEEAQRLLEVSFAQGCDPLRQRASRQALEGVVRERQAQVMLHVCFGVVRHSIHAAFSA